MLNNTADFFDWADTIPGSLLPQIKAQAASRFSLVDLGGSTYYIFMNMTEKPFSSQLAREAVVTGLNEHGDVTGSARARSIPACFFLPPDVPGHPRPRVVPVRQRPGHRRTSPRPSSWCKQSGMAGHAGHGLEPGPRRRVSSG